MRIGIDASFLQHYRAGLYQYTLRLITGLQELDADNEYTLFFSEWGDPECRKTVGKFNFKPNFHVHVCSLPDRVMGVLGRLRPPFRPFLDRFDVLHGPTFRLPPGRSSRKAVVTIHDLKFLRRPDLFSDRRVGARYARHTTDALKRADVYVAVSQSTRDEISEAFQIPYDRIRVIYPGVGGEFFAKPDLDKVAQLKCKYGISTEYILSVGFFEEKKNLSRILDAYASVRNSLPQAYKLVLAGQEGPSSPDVLRKIQELCLEDAVILPGYVPAEDLPALYAGASLFVFPSLHEGFGIPAVEAMACGVPVIVSNISALTEVVGSAGLLVDPYRLDDIAEAILSICRDENLRLNLKQRGLDRAKQFSAGRLAQDTLQLYRELGSV